MRVSSLFEVVSTKRLERVSSDFADSTSVENIANLATVLQIPNSLGRTYPAQKSALTKADQKSLNNESASF